jgi:ferredoxin-NADP reductase
MASIFETTIASIHRMTPRVKQYLLRADGHTFDHRPGQHTVLRYEGDDGNEVRRPYSPVNLPGTSVLALAIKRYDGGTASVWMDERSVGDRVRVTAPNGNLYLRDTDRDVVFLSTGTGITPMIAMLKQYLRDGTGRAAFLYGERTQQDLMYRETLDHLSADHDTLSVLYSLSDEDWSGPTGHVQTHLDAVLGERFDNPHYYLCGVPQMVVETEALLEARGVDDERVFAEGWEKAATS